SSQEMPTDIKGQTGDNVGIVRMFATEYAKNNVPYTDYLEKLRTIKVSGVKELTFEEQVNGPPVGAPVTVTFRSNNGESLDALIKKVMDKLKSVNGVFDVKVDDVFGPDEVKVLLDYEKLDRLGLTTASVG